MSAVTIIPAAQFREGRWLNGMGVSWDIAAEPPGAGPTDFGWRFAIAQIDVDVPFSRYPNVDRVLRLIEGRGLALSAHNHLYLEANPFFPQVGFDGEAETHCRLDNGPCRVLNLFLRRGQWRDETETRSYAFEIDSCDTALLFALRGDFTVDGLPLARGDAAIAGPGVRVSQTGRDGLIYVARLFREG